MKRLTIPDISIYQIQLFLIVAEEQNFSRAAEMMNMTQPTLSKRISSLENAIGLQLFTREKRPVELTEQGKILYQRWKNVCSQIQSSIDEAYRYSDNEKNDLTVCWFDSGSNLGAISLVGRQLGQLYQDLSFHLCYSSFGKWRSLLAKDEIDLMITIEMEKDQLSDDLTWAQITTCPKLIAMLESNPLSRKENLSLKELHNQKFVILSPIDAPVYHRYVQALCRAQGFEPQISRYAPDANSLISCIENDDDVLICDRFLRNLENPLIKTFAIPETYSGLIAVWKKSNRKPYLEDFVELLKIHYLSENA